MESYAARRAARRLIECLARDDAHMAEAPRVAMFEFGDRSTRLQILQGDEVIHECDHPFGVNALTDAVQTPRDMAAALDSFRAGSSPGPVHAVLLAGSAATLAGLSEAVIRQL